jgi:HK97 gp10 family phage protein
MQNPGVRDRVGQALFVAAGEIQTEARHLISEGSVSGKGHVASLPGEPPNMDTRHLMNNIEAYRTGETSAEVRSEASYAAALEFGTSKMAPRPYMKPATDRKRGRITQLVHAVVEATIRRGG